MCVWFLVERFRCNTRKRHLKNAPRMPRQPLNTSRAPRGRSKRDVTLWRPIDTSLLPNPHLYVIRRTTGLHHLASHPATFVSLKSLSDSEVMTDEWTAPTPAIGLPETHEGMICRRFERVWPAVCSRLRQFLPLEPVPLRSVAVDARHSGFAAKANSSGVLSDDRTNAVVCPHKAALIAGVVSGVEGVTSSGDVCVSIVDDSLRRRAAPPVSSQHAVLVASTEGDVEGGDDQGDHHPQHRFCHAPVRCLLHQSVATDPTYGSFLTSIGTGVILRHTTVFGGSGGSGPTLIVCPTNVVSVFPATVVAVAEEGACSSGRPFPLSPMTSARRRSHAPRFRDDDDGGGDPTDPPTLAKIAGGSRDAQPPHLPPTPPPHSGHRTQQHDIHHVSLPPQPVPALAAAPNAALAVPPPAPAIAMARCEAVSERLFTPASPAASDLHSQVPNVGQSSLPDSRTFHQPVGSTSKLGALLAARRVRHEAQVPSISATNTSARDTLDGTTALAAVTTNDQPIYPPVPVSGQSGVTLTTSAPVDSSGRMGDPPTATGQRSVGSLLAALQSRRRARE